MHGEESVYQTIIAIVIVVFSFYLLSTLYPFSFVKYIVIECTRRLDGVP